MPKSILALDIATTTGFAIRGRSGAITSGWAELPAKNDDRPGARLQAFRKWLGDKKFNAGHIDAVYWEDAFRQPGKAGELFGNMVGVLLEWCESHDVAVYGSVNASTLKKFATGHGHASKDKMVAAARVAGFKGVFDHNEADAIHILRWAIQKNPDLEKEAA